MQFCLEKVKKSTKNARIFRLYGTTKGKSGTPTLKHFRAREKNVEIEMPKMRQFHV